jgi:YHS domain-containing protein
MLLELALMGGAGLVSGADDPANTAQPRGAALTLRGSEPNRPVDPVPKAVPSNQDRADTRESKRPSGGMLRLRPPENPVTVVEPQETPGDSGLVWTSRRPLVESISRDPEGRALGGYDVVAYFSAARAVKGEPAYSHEYHGVLWLFSTKEHREQFAREPERYLPQYGGYCAYAVAKGYIAPADPEVWRIDGARLYLNYDRAVQKVWESDYENLIRRADHNWPGLHK